MNRLLQENVKELLELKYQEFQNPNFIEFDPIQIPHQFTTKEDIEISAFLTSIISWGNRKAIIKSAKEMMEHLGQSPYDFVMSHSKSDLEKVQFQYRTFKVEDFRYFITALQQIYLNGGLEAFFSRQFAKFEGKEAISKFHEYFLSFKPLERTRKHIANPNKGSSAKRINMLSWVIRMVTCQNKSYHLQVTQVVLMIALLKSQSL